MITILNDLNSGKKCTQADSVKSHILVQIIEFWRILANHLIWMFAPKFNKILEF